MYVHHVCYAVWYVDYQIGVLLTRIFSTWHINNVYFLFRVLCIHLHAYISTYGLCVHLNADTTYVCVQQNIDIIMR